MSVCYCQGKKTMSKTAPVEMGTQQDDVDYAWLPKETTTDFSKLDSCFYHRIFITVFQILLD